MLSRSHKAKFLFVLLFAFYPATLWAAGLSPKAMYARCYAQVVNKPVPLNHADYLSVQQGTKSAIDACVALLDKAQLTSTGDMQNPNDLEARSILNNFYEFHRTWFPTSDASQILGYQHEFDNPTIETLELSTPALAITYSLFFKSPYKDVLRGQDDYYPVRTTLGDSSTTNFKIKGLDANSAAIDMMVPAVAQTTGPLIGVHRKQLQTPIGNFVIMTQSGSVVRNPELGVNLPANFSQNFGGGGLGQQSYFALNNGHPKGQVFDGALKLPRKWAKVSLESFMCLTLPALRENDVAKYLVPNSSVPFRQAKSCITCHASMDQFATTARNLYIGQTTHYALGSIFVGNYVANQIDASSWLAEGVSNFKNQKPTGRLMYRSYVTGNLVDTPVQNMDDLGQHMSNSLEYYQCAAKRYFEYFTGISVSLYDRTHTANAMLNKNLTDRDVKDRRFVENLAENLQRSQSLSQMISEIIRSPYYRSSTSNPNEVP